MSLSLTVENKPKLQKTLLDWFKYNGRNFPWRTQTNPYYILVAEKLLQQTAVNDRLINIYNKLISNYPTPKLLAKADITTLEDIIQPLGLRYRAKEFHLMANELILRHNGQVPRDLQKLMQLSGTGEYIARAVLSFAFREDIPVIDINVARFIYRILGLKGKLPANPARKRTLIELATKLIPNRRSKEFNLAIIDLCAQICKPNKPECMECPIKMYCGYYFKTLK